MGHGVEVFFHGLTLRFNMFVWIVICSCGGQWAARALIGALQWQQQCLCYDIVWKYGPSPAQRRAQTSRNTAKEISTPARPSHWWEAAPCRPSSYYGVKTVMSCPVSSVMYTHIVLWRLRTLHAPIQTSYNSSYLQGGHWTVDRWLHHTAACYRVNVIFHNELHSVSLCNVSGPGAGGGGVRCPTHCLWDPITITTSVRAAGHWAGLGTSLTTQVWSPTAAPPPPTTITTSKPSKLATRLILPKHLDIPYPFKFRT